MNAQRSFKIGHVAAEGFKGFTARQEITLDGRHLFLLGENGRGKSSIVEAIRWGLFGSTRRPNEVIANQRYTGPCRVEIGLQRSAEHLRLRRTLLRGASGGSDAIITDASGKEVPIRDVLPQLESTGAGEGMHIVYAAQAEPVRRGPEDMRPFERTIYAYLGLSQLPELIGSLEKFLADQEDEENELGGQITQKRREIEANGEALEQRRDQFLKNPPWGAGIRVPDIQETATRIRRFIQDVGGDPGSVAELKALLDLATEALEHAKSRDTGELKKQASELDIRISSLQSILTRMRSSEANLASAKNTLSEQRSSLERTLSGQTVTELETQLELAESTTKLKTGLRALQVAGYEYLESLSAQDGLCPLCGSSVSRLLEILAAVVSTAPDGGPSTETLEASRSLLDMAKNMEEVIRNLEHELASLERDLSIIEEEASRILTSEGRSLSGPDTQAALDALLASVRSRHASITKEMMDASTTHGEWARQLQRLRDEVEFQDVLSRLRTADIKISLLDQLEARLRDLTAFGASVRELTEQLRAILKERLASSAPQINEALTRAFRGLTDHPVYDYLFIDESRLPRLELLIDCSTDPEGGITPSSVLNGQAVSALELVPYFAFSELTEFPFEVYLLLLDDPTQSFDSRHIRILIERLAHLGRRVQLVVATHESDTFEQIIPEFFADGEYVAVKISDFTKRGGPIFSYVGRR